MLLTLSQCPRALAPIRMLQVFEGLVKSEHDKCNYRLITLPNKLQAILVSESTLEKVNNYCLSASEESTNVIVAL